MKLRIGARGSLLSRWQAEHVRSRLRKAHPQLELEIVLIRTTGDRLSKEGLLSGVGKGLFVKEIEEALLAQRIDLAVHSLKDLPTQLPPGLQLAAILRREDCRDAFLTVRPWHSLAQLPQGARIGTSSLRRKVQLLDLRPDLRVEPLRGNIDTRLKKLESGDWDGVVLALAGLKRLGLVRRVAFPFSLEEILPAVGQGALAVEARREDGTVLPFLSCLDDPLTHRCVSAERLFLQEMGGGCQVPMGAHAEVDGEKAVFRAVVAHPRGTPLLRYCRRAEAKELDTLAREAARHFLQQGAAAFLAATEEL